MPNVAIQKAGGLPSAAKPAVEGLLGRPLEADEEVTASATTSRAARVISR